MEMLKKIDKNLTVCKIPTTVQDISEKVFSSYDSLESIECDSDYFKSIDGVLFTADYKTLVRYPPKKNGTDYVVPDSVVNIGSCAFRNCEFLENIILPNSLTRIGEEAFNYLSKKDNCILSLDYTNLTNEIIRSITKNPIKIEPNEKCKLLFVGKEDCRLTLEDVYNLSSLFQSVVGSGLVWDIIGDYLYTGESQDLDGYLLINPDLINQ